MMTALFKRMQEAKKPRPPWCDGGGAFSWARIVPCDPAKIQVRGLPDDAKNYRMRVDFNQNKIATLIVLHGDKKAREYLVCYARNLSGSTLVWPDLDDMIRGNY